jgi:hypothetical protein
LRIGIKGDVISIKGSIAKYFHGNNLKLFRPVDLGPALNMLSHELGFNVGRGRLYRIDIADNLYLSKDPREYLNALLVLPRSISTANPTSKYFKRSNTTCLFYDKRKELKAKDSVTYQRLLKNAPESNILRYELRFECRLASFFKVKIVKVAHLLSSTFRKKLAEAWVNHYDLIIKERIEEYPEIKSPDKVKRLIMYKGIAAMGGYKSLAALVDDISQKNDWPSQTKYRIKSLLKKIANDDFLSIESPLVKELGNAIYNSNIVKLYINTNDQ